MEIEMLGMVYAGLLGGMIGGLLATLSSKLTYRAHLDELQYLWREDLDRALLIFQKHSKS